ncbi:MAG: dUTP diphosphatase [Beijerinckiaceae bacterium]|jgi:dUTP pyrophosphatase|nr:dUTP diphosphatase [Beijerinckiaceae bacterium]MDO9441882.1 dUTP diphosphatase [Beijerinckiaceae bacterium]
MTVTLRVRRLAHGADLPLPTYQSASAAGLDLVAAIGRNARLVLEPGGRDLVPTGFAIEVPEGYEAQIRPRSGLALKFGVTVLNSPGTIDSDYRGEVCIILINHGSEPFEIARGDRIAQMVIAPVVRASTVEVAELTSTTRGDGGFGSTGVTLPGAS